jgi:GT2 family glycosyltransferase
MQVSFVIPLFNCLELTRACVGSLQRTLPPSLAHEIILVDDGSTDGTRAWLATLDTTTGPFRVVLNERNLGYAGANNRGARAARGRLLVLLNNDLVLTRGWLEPMLAVHASLGATAGFVGNVQRNVRTRDLDHTGIVINHQGKPVHDTFNPRWLGRSSRPVPAVTGACLLTSRDLFLHLGGFDEGFVNGGEDIDLCFRAAARGCRHAVALRSVIYHHVSASPGRKARDEANSRRLTLRWRDALARQGARRWCSYYLCEYWIGPTSNPDLALARSALACTLGLRRTPPSGALAGMQAALDRELTRWSVLLDGSPSPTTPAAESPAVL